MWTGGKQYGTLAAAVCAALVCRTWIRRRKRRTVTSASRPKAAVAVVEKESGKVLDLEVLLHDVSNSDKWIVASDAGPYTLTVAEYALSIDVVPEEDIEEMLSHRWHPTLDTTLGPVPVPMLEARYARPTWIDFLNHFNIRKHCMRVLDGMGGLYAAKPCRALYLEPGTDETTQVECVSRAWMWQELSVGPQKHTHANIDTLLLHHVVTEGEMAVFDSLLALAMVTTKLAALALCRRLQPHRTLWRSLRRTWSRAVLLLGSRLMTGMLAMVSLDVSLGEAEIVAYRAGNLRAALMAIFEVQFKGSTESQACIEALCAELGDSAEGIDDQLLGVAAVLVDVCVQLGACAGKVVAARQRGGEEDTAITIHMQLMDAFSRLARCFVGRRQSVPFSQLCMGMFHARAEGSTLSSAVANLGNRNITFKVDSLAASFGVLCAAQGLRCEPRLIEDMVYSARTVNVHCLAAEDACGVSSVARKRVRVGVRNLRSQNSWWATALFSAAFGRWIQSGVCDLEIGGRLLRGCPVDVLGPSWWAQSWRQAARRDGSAGLVMRYSIVEGELEDMSVTLDGGGHLELCGVRGAGCSMAREEFSTWHAALTPE